MRSYNSGQSNGLPNNTNDLTNYFGALSQNTDPANLALGQGMMQDWHKKLLQKYFFNEASYTIQTVGDQQEYPLPFDYSKLKTGTVTVGNLKWVPTEVLTRQEWDTLNVFPYYADIPSNFYIYGGKFNLWPIPSTGSTTLTYTPTSGTVAVGDIITEGTNTGKVLTVDLTTFTLQVAVDLGSVFTTGNFSCSPSGATGTILTTSITAGNTITFNYQKRVPDMFFQDYITGTVTATNNSITLTGSGTSWLTYFSPTASDVLYLNLWLKITPPAGDGGWYQIQTINSNTSLNLVQPYQGQDVAGATYTIGQMPLLLEDFHDLIVWEPLVTYFSTIQPDENKATRFKTKLEEGMTAMDNYVGTKSLNVNLGQRIRQVNPNLFQDNNIH